MNGILTTMSRLPVFRRQGQDAAALKQLAKLLAGVPRYTPGQVTVGGWHFHYVDAPALLSTFDVVMVKRWNDFTSRRTDPIIYDCGANIGVTALHYKRLFPRARITVFEPDQAICAVLRRNLAANQVSDVTVVEAAVWKSNGEHAFHAEGADGSRLVTVVNPSLDNDYAVKTVRLADYLAEGPVDFVKLDIEGAEAEVLIDCADSLGQVQSMVIEFHLMNYYPQPLAATFDVLVRAGFQVSVNSYGPWVDLAHPPAQRPAGNLGFDQYVLICAWHPS